MKLLVVVVLFSFSSSVLYAGIVRNNYVDWLVVGNKQQSHFIQLQNDFNDGECKVNGGTRVRFSYDNGNLLSLFLTAKVSKKKIGFYYTTDTKLPVVSGHGTSTCQITNAWLESD